MMAVTQALGPLHTVLFCSGAGDSVVGQLLSFFRLEVGLELTGLLVKLNLTTAPALTWTMAPHLEILTPEVRVLCPSLLALPHAGDGAPTSASIFTSLWKWHEQIYEVDPTFFRCVYFGWSHQVLGRHYPHKGKKKDRCCGQGARQLTCLGPFSRIRSLCIQCLYS